MSQLHVDEQPLADSFPTDTTFLDDMIYGSSDDLADATYDCYQFPTQPQIVATRADEVQTDHHASWASATPASESAGYLPVPPEAGTENNAAFHLSGNSECGFQSQSDRTLLPSAHFSSDDGASVPPYNLHQSVGMITRTPAFPPHLPAYPDQLASGSAQPSDFCTSHTPLRRMTWCRDLDLCPNCSATTFPSAWTMEHLGCAHCQHWFFRSMTVQPEFLSAPAPILDRHRSPSICSFQNRSRKGKSPQTRGRRPVKTSSLAVQEYRCCPFTSSGNISLPCSHENCSPPPDIGPLSRRFEENEKWERARKEAIASFSYENCGFYKLPIEIIWMIVDLYPRLDYSYMRSIRAEPSVYNHRFEVLRNLIGVSKCCRKTFYNMYWETFEIALTYPRKRGPGPDQFDLGVEPARYVSRVNELQGLRKTFWNLQDTATCVRALTFRVDRDPEIMQLFVDCLLALPNLHTLEIAPTSLPLVTLFCTAFKTRPQYRSVRKLIAPSGVHPILQCLPNLEELVCTRGEKPHILLARVFQAYDSTNTITSFRSFELIGSCWTDLVGKELLRCFPSIQKIAMRKPAVAHLEKLTSLTEISEIDLWIPEGSDATFIKRLKAKATEVLRKSNPRTVCKCGDAMDVDLEPSVKQEPGVKLEHEIKLEYETKPVVCMCKPPKRIFRLKHLVRRHGQWGTPFWGSERVEEIEVSPLEE